MRCLPALLFALALFAQSDPTGARYYGLKQINTHTVAGLEVAWTYRTGALEPATALNHKAAFESTPLLVDGLLYVTTPFNAVIALDPETGAEKWKFDPKVDRTVDYSEVTNRGVAVWTDAKARRDAPCRVRLFEGTLDARLLAVDAKTGKFCANFGNGGAVDLSRDAGPVRRGQYEVTSAPAIAGDVVITGSSIGDNAGVELERGIVRGYDARTGKLLWTWDPIPWSRQQTPHTGAANAWSTISADPARDMVFVPTGSASPDYYGGLRPGNNQWANSVVALRASTGRLVWGFQVVHHDLWDYDVASQPVLIQFRGRPAVAVTTKMGSLFVLDRENGKPLHAVEERPVPKSDVRGEEASPTQPVPAWAPMNPQQLWEEDLWGPTPEALAACKEQYRKLRYEGMFTPPSVKGSLVFPGNVGGVNWGGAAWDPQSGILLANTNRLAAVVRVIARDDMPGAVRDAEQNRMTGEFGRQSGAPYGMYRDWLLTPGPVPCNRPPWGALVAYDLAAGKIKWESPVGEMVPGVKTGSPTLGGPMVTAGGLVFTAGAMDTAIRAFDLQTGGEVWKAQLPASAQSTPTTYEAGGRQYLVVCAGGHGKLNTKMGDFVVAFRVK
jgi:quinoprotein glucose dehydrogenase